MGRQPPTSCAWCTPRPPRSWPGPEHRRTARLLGDNGVDDPEAWLGDARDQVLAALREHGPMTARALGDAVPALRHQIVMAPGKR